MSKTGARRSEVDNLIIGPICFMYMLLCLISIAVSGYPYILLKGLLPKKCNLCFLCGGATGMFFWSPQHPPLYTSATGIYNVAKVMLGEISHIGGRVIQGLAYCAEERELKNCHDSCLTE